MSRRRFISTRISTDTAINELATQSDFAALLYTWMIPHALDDGIVYGDPETLLFTVIPGRRDKNIDDIVAALELIESVKAEVRDSDGTTRSVPLIRWDRRNNRVVFPSSTFYKYQTNIKGGSRRTGSGVDFPVIVPMADQDDDHANDVVEISGNQRNTLYDTLDTKLNNNIFNLNNVDNITPQEAERAKVERVLAIMPTRGSNNAQEIVKDAIRRYPYVPIGITVQAMRMVLDKYNKPEHRNRTDWASLFAKQLEWQAKEYAPDQSPVLSYDELLQQREAEKLRAQRLAEEQLAQLEEEKIGR
jgi:hypothetical protein